MKKTIILITIFSGLLFFVISSDNVYKESSTAGKLAKVWKKIDKTKIYKIKIEKDGAKNVFKRDGDHWQLSEPLVSELDEDSMDSLLKGIESIELKTLISSKKEKRESFQVDDKNGLKVTVYGKDGKEMRDFVIGKSTPDFNHLYLRPTAADNVYWALGFKRYQFDKETKIWRNRNILKFNKDDADKILLKSKDTSIVLRKEGENWQIIGPERYSADKNVVNGVLNILSNFVASDFEDEKSLADVSLTDNLEFSTTVESKGQQIGVLLFGAEDKGGNIYVQNASKNQIFKVSVSRVDSLRKGVDDFKVSSEPEKNFSSQSDGQQP